MYYGSIEKVFWSDESCFTVFPTSGRFCVLWTPLQAYAGTICCQELSIIGILSWFKLPCYGILQDLSLQWKITLLLRIMSTMADHVHPMDEVLFPNGDVLFQDDKASVHTSRIDQRLVFWTWGSIIISTMATTITRPEY